MHAVATEEAVHRMQDIVKRKLSQRTKVFVWASNPWSGEAKVLAC